MGEKKKITYHSLAYAVLLRERMANDPTYTVTRLNEELESVARAGYAASKEKK